MCIIVTTLRSTQDSFPRIAIRSQLRPVLQPCKTGWSQEKPIRSSGPIRAQPPLLSRQTSVTLLLGVSCP